MSSIVVLNKYRSECLENKLNPNYVRPIFHMKFLSKTYKCVFFLISLFYSSYINSSN